MRNISNPVNILYIINIHKQFEVIALYTFIINSVSYSTNSHVNDLIIGCSHLFTYVRNNYKTAE